MKINEIGSNFFLTPDKILKAKNRESSESKLSIFGNNPAVLTANGSWALKLALSLVKTSCKKALLPNFLCDSIVDAFHFQKFDIDYYSIKRDLSPDVDELNKKLSTGDYSVLYICSLFGFNTSKSLHTTIERIKGRVIVIEDTTHSLYSDYKHTNADYLICSLRKWNEIPDGGALLCSKIDSESFDVKYPEPKEIVANFIEASKYKYDYFNNQDKSQKTRFREYYVLVDESLDALAMSKMSYFSRNVLNDYDIEEMKIKRRENYKYLSANIKNDKILDIIFPELPDDVVPLYMPVYVKNGKRDDFQRYMALKDIYCPIHWPIPDDILTKYGKQSLDVANNIISIVIDQRYGISDMERIINRINDFCSDISICEDLNNIAS